jgi:hypothetical protein
VPEPGTMLVLLSMLACYVGGSRHFASIRRS